MPASLNTGGNNTAWLSKCQPRVRSPEDSGRAKDDRGIVYRGAGFCFDLVPARRYNPGPGSANPVSTNPCSTPRAAVWRPLSREDASCAAA